jgi:serine protease Do
MNKENEMTVAQEHDQPAEAVNDMHGIFSEQRHEIVPKAAKRMRNRKPGLWKRVAAVALALALIAGSGTLYGQMNNELAKQAAVIGTLSQQLADQQLAIAKTDSVLGLTKDLAAKAEALNNTNPAAVSQSGSVLSQATLVQGSSVTEIAKTVGPSVVGIRMTVSGNRQGLQGQGTSEGSGIIISSDGYIMTNYHVVSSADPKSGTSAATTLEVFLPDGRSAKAKFVGGDSENDLSVVKIELNGLPVAKLGKSADLQVGELAVAIGNPLGMEFAGSVTVGVVSALNRKIDGQEASLSLIQTDAAINPGNSGGALVNSKGLVIGINSAKISATGVEGLGFAIAIDDAKPIVNSLILYGYIKNRPYMGINGQDITDVMASMYNVPVGVYVTSVDPASGAAKAGIAKGDIITGINDKPITSMADINAVKKAYKPGDAVTVNLMRDTTKMSVKVTFTEAK